MFNNSNLGSGRAFLRTHANPIRTERRRAEPSIQLRESSQLMRFQSIQPATMEYFRTNPYYFGDYVRYESVGRGLNAYLNRVRDWVCESNNLFVNKNQSELDMIRHFVDICFDQHVRGLRDSVYACFGSSQSPNQIYRENTTHLYQNLISKMTSFMYSLAGRMDDYSLVWFEPASHLGIDKLLPNFRLKRCFDTENSRYYYLIDQEIKKRCSFNTETNCMDYTKDKEVFKTDDV